MKNFDTQHENFFYDVRLEPKKSGKPDGPQRHVWIEQKDGRPVRYTKEPNTTKIPSCFLAHSSAGRGCYPANFGNRILMVDKATVSCLL